MSDRYYDLANRAAAEIINLHHSYKPPVEGYVSVLRVIERVIGVLEECQACQRERMMKPSRN